MAFDPVHESAVADEQDGDFPCGLRDHYMEAAQKVWPKGTVLRCARCGRTQKVSVEQAAKFLAGGWPKCHGERMWIGDMDQN